jgi:hypothetical protein
MLTISSVSYALSKETNRGELYLKIVTAMGADYIFSTNWIFTEKA